MSSAAHVTSLVIILILCTISSSLAFYFPCDIKTVYVAQTSTLKPTPSSASDFYNVLDFTTISSGGAYALYQLPSFSTSQNTTTGIYHVNFGANTFSRVVSTSAVNSNIFAVGTSNAANNSKIIAAAQRTLVTADKAKFHFLFLDTLHHAIVQEFQFFDVNKNLDPVYNETGSLLGTEDATTDAEYISWSAYNPVALGTLSTFSDSERPMFVALVSTAKSMKLFLYKDALTATPIAKQVIIPNISYKNSVYSQFTNIGFYVPFRIGNFDATNGKQSVYFTLRVYVNEIPSFENFFNMTGTLKLTRKFPFDYVQVLFEVLVTRSGSLSIASITQVGTSTNSIRLYDVSVTPIAIPNEAPTILLSGSTSPSSTLVPCAYVAAFKGSNLTFSSCVSNYDASEFYACDMRNENVICGGIGEKNQFVGSIAYAMNITRDSSNSVKVVFYQFLDALNEQVKSYNYEYIVNIRFNMAGQIVAGRAYYSNDLQTYSYMGILDLVCTNNTSLRTILIASLVTGVAFLIALFCFVGVMIAFTRIVSKVTNKGELRPLNPDEMSSSDAQHDASM